ncbi:MAG: argininosuccinate lyase [Candidatus Schekmanbacteria bacterium]|nr:argininosuccinate lyase [Candidatus Schekmanbacteria bacterium]
MSRLWDKGEALDSLIARFTVGRDPELDLHLVPYDALASAAHAMMLRHIGVLSATDCGALVAELATIASESRVGRFAILAAEEDAHTAIENRLTKRLGEAGRRIHTGRSRNDQVIAALRLFAREALVEQAEALAALVEELLRRGEELAEVSLPGYTHTRQAMPSTLGFHFAACASGLLDAFPWMKTALEHVNRSPLGSASGFGVALPLDRALVARLLAFDSVQRNTLAVQNDRGKTEALTLAALLGPVGDLGRLAADLILLSSDEWRCLTLPAELTTGSSIMPQKRNPDALELVRAESSRHRARLAEIAGVYGPLLCGYHRDLQLTKGPFVEGMRAALDVFHVMRRIVSGLRVDEERCRTIMQRDIGATDAAYERVAAGMAFRDAYREVGKDPAAAVTGDPAASWRLRRHEGAPGDRDLSADWNRLALARQWVYDARTRFDAAWRLLGERDSDDTGALRSAAPHATMDRDAHAGARDRLS